MKNFNILSFFLFTAFLFTIQTVIAQEWTQIGQDIDGEAGGDWSGHSVSMSADGTIVAIGESQSDCNGQNSGQARIFELQNGTWIQLGDDIEGISEGEKFGSDVSLNSDGSIVAIGAHNGNNEYGQVRVFENQNNVWTQIGNSINGDDLWGKFGCEVSINADGSIVAIGAEWGNGNIGNSCGYVQIYENQNGTWAQIGQTIEGETASASAYGMSLCLNLDGNIVAIGTIDNDESAGLVRVFEYQVATWEQIGEDIEGFEGDYLGRSVSLSSDGSIIAIGVAVANDHRGEARIYENLSGTWTKIGESIIGEEEADEFGTSIDLNSDGTIVAVGAIWHNGINGINSGQVRIFENQNNTWTKIGQGIDGEAEMNFSGNSVSLSSDGSVVAIGAQSNSGNGNQAGHTRIFSFALPSTVNDITNFDVPNQVGSETIDETEHTVNLDVETGTDITDLAPTIEISENATIDPESGTPQDFTEPFVYTVTAENGDQQEWTVTVDVLTGISSNYSSSFKIYPNPSNGTVNLTGFSGLSDFVGIKITNITRQTIYSTKHIPLQIDLSSFPNGIYFIETQTENGVFTEKLILQ